MNVSTAIKSRRAIKAFDPSHRISKDETEQLLSLALLSPTSFCPKRWGAVRLLHARFDHVWGGFTAREPTSYRGGCALCPWRQFMPLYRLWQGHTSHPQSG